ncbi:DUF1698 domain-containing protein, partial [Escherichia coli]
MRTRCWYQAIVTRKCVMSISSGDENTVLVPGDRYAQMRNVYFI